MAPTPAQSESFEEQFEKVYRNVQAYNKKLTQMRGGGTNSFELRKDIAKILYKSGRYPPGKYRQHFVNAKAIIDEARRQSPQGYEERARQLAREPESYTGTRQLADDDEDMFSLSQYDSNGPDFR